MVGITYVYLSFYISLSWESITTCRRRDDYFSTLSCYYLCFDFLKNIMHIMIKHTILVRIDKHSNLSVSENFVFGFIRYIYKY